VAISNVAVGGKITAATTNSMIAVDNAVGQISVIPTSVAGTGVAVGAAGKVTFTTAATISVNGCFTSTYDNYLIEFNASASSTPNNLNLRFRLSGTDDSSANYDQQGTNSGGATVSAAQALAGTSIGLEAVNASIHDITFKVLAPNLAQATRGDALARTTANPATAIATATAIRQFLFRSSTQFDGFTITASTGNITGTLRIYGLNNN